MRIKEGNKEADILKAAMKVFAKSGYHNAKISKIAEVADIATGSIYVYFKSKEHILLRLFDDIWHKLYNSLLLLVNRNDLSSVEKFDAMIDLLFDNFTENSATAIVIANEQNQLLTREKIKFTEYYEKFLDLGEKIIREGISRKVFNPNFNIDIFRHYMLGAFRDFIREWAVNTDRTKLNTIRENIKFLTKYGILNHQKK